MLQTGPRISRTCLWIFASLSLWTLMILSSSSVGAEGNAAVVPTTGIQSLLWIDVIMDFLWRLIPSETMAIYL